MQPSNYTRNCPGCGKELSYRSPVSFKFAEDNNQKCKDCCERKNRIAPELVQQILDMNAQGVLNREIARTLSIHHRTVAEYLNKHGREQNFANQPIDKVSDIEARCRKCGEIKPIDEFQFGRKGQQYEYRFSFCNACRNKQVYLNLNSDVNKFLADRFHRMKRRAKDKGIPCTITKEEFIAQYHRQKGLCFYTDVPMVCEVGSDLHRDSMSIDKLIPERGYVIDNVVLTTHRINTCKCDLSLDEIERWMPEWYKKISFFLNQYKVMLPPFDALNATCPFCGFCCEMTSCIDLFTEEIKWQSKTYYCSSCKEAYYILHDIKEDNNNWMSWQGFTCKDLFHKCIFNQGQLDSLIVSKISSSEKDKFIRTSYGEIFCNNGGVSIPVLDMKDISILDRSRFYTKIKNLIPFV